MWVLPSRSRPLSLKRLLAAWHATGATAPVWLRLDADDPSLGEYLALPLPVRWAPVIGPRAPLSRLYAEAYQNASSAPWWGFLADDVVPETPGWDVRLATVAGDDGMAVPAGGHDPEGTPHFVLGAGLVRETGWLALPGLSRLYIDTAWADIAAARGVLRRCPGVVLRHRHFSNRTALMDGTYRKPAKAADRAVYETWKAKEFP